MHTLNAALATDENALFEAVLNILRCAELAEVWVRRMQETYS
jgi:hypothetical protein